MQPCDFSLQLHPEAQLLDLGGGCLELTCLGERCLVQTSSEGTRQAVEQLRRPGAEPGALEPLGSLLQVLSQGPYLCPSARQQGSELAELMPLSPNFRWVLSQPDPDTRYRLSRLAYLRWHDELGLVLETPAAAARLCLKHPGVWALIGALGQPARMDELSSLSASGVESVLSLLLAMQAITAVDDEGKAQEDERVPTAWMFHDLLFHATSQLGRSPVKTTKLFEAYPDPPTSRGKPPMSDQRIELPDPEAQGGSFDEVLRRRTSLRDYGPALSLEQVGAFLRRVTRFTDREMMGETYLSRAYPSGGALYEQELYLLAHRCQGLTPGVYHYRPQDHHLYQLPVDHTGCDKLFKILDQQTRANLGILVSARFPDIGNVYRGLAYRLVLQNWGAMLQTMYLVATDLGLAPCAVGAGDAEIFAQVTGLDYYQEPLVGQFNLGTRPQG